MCENKFYYCAHCGNIVGWIKNSGVPMICCGEKMRELEPNTVDASVEKHVPVVETMQNGLKVTIGDVEHPMTEEHHIEWVYVETDRGGMRKCLAVGEKPTVEFALLDEKPLAVFAYCNLHGLWVKKI